MDSVKEKWEEIKESMRKEYDLSQISFNTWINPLKYGSTKNNNVTILIPSDQAHALNYISNKYKTFFQVTISEMLGDNYEVSFELENNFNNEEEISTKAIVSNKKNINEDNSNLNPKYTFDTFVVGANNRFAHSASLAVAESPGEVYNPLFIYGGPGLGKTHLMHSIGHFILDNNPKMKILYVTSEQFTNEVIESIRSGNAQAMTKLRDKYRTVDVLMVDDVQFIIGKESTQEEFFHTFNTLQTSGKQIILSSDRPPKEMETLEERFRSRFEWGLTADIQQPDYETRVAILLKNAESCDKQIDQSIIEYIATNITSNIRELEGAFNKVVALSKLNKVNITMEVAEEALKDIVSPNKKREITPQLIIEVVADHYNVPAADITSKKRNSEFALPRQIVMYLCRHLTEISLNNVGKILGKKDHTTVMHGVRKIEEDIKTNEELKDNIDAIIKKINP